MEVVTADEQEPEAEAEAPSEDAEDLSSLTVAQLRERLSGRLASLRCEGGAHRASPRCLVICPGARDEHASRRRGRNSSCLTGPDRWVRANIMDDLRIETPWGKVPLRVGTDGDTMVFLQRHHGFTCDE